MPELPEVETIKRGLEPALRGRAIVRAKVLDARPVAPLSPASFEKKIKGQIIEGLSRRGKYLRIELRAGLILVIHLRMTGRLTHVVMSFDEVPRRHLRLFFFLDDGTGLAFHDQRRFGTVRLLTSEESDEDLRRLGPEPLERSFNKKLLKEILDARQRPIKSLLLDQSLIAGIGNIYADEALFRAGIHPSRRAADISDPEAALLTRAIKETLRSAIAHEGSSVDTYRTAGGRRGSFQKTFRVHRRAGEPCPGCGGTVKKIKLAGRGTYFCPKCQK